MVDGNVKRYGSAPIQVAIKEPRNPRIPQCWYCLCSQRQTLSLRRSILKYLRKAPLSSDPNSRFQTAGEIHLSSGGDGRELLYFGPNGSITSVPVETGATFRPGASQVLFQVPQLHESDGFHLHLRRWRRSAAAGLITTLSYILSF